MINKNIYLDKVYQAPKKPILLVVDLRVALYILLQESMSLPQDFDRTLLWQRYLNGLPGLIHPTLNNNEFVHLCVVDDWRSGIYYNYWREQWLRDNYPKAEEYKGNRGTTSEADRTDDYRILLEAAYKYINKENIPIYRQEGFEADDCMGEIFRKKHDMQLPYKRSQTIMITIDNDWGILVDDEEDILMYVNGTFRVPISRLRSEYEVKQYYLERENLMLKSTYDIVDHKVEYGDKSDNISPGTPREVIDLRNPPVQPILDVRNIFDWKPNHLEAFKALQEICKTKYLSLLQ